MFAIVNHSKGSRFYILQRRIHHGLVGVILTIIGGYLIFDDRKDFPFLADNK